MTPELHEYRETLHDLIHSSESNMLLFASERFNKEGNKEQVPNGVFELVSRRFQREFITLWELFKLEDDGGFETCMTNLALLARKVREKTPYEGIITCTPTAHLLMEQIHARVEFERDPLSLYYLGNYPFLNLEKRALFDFRNQNILILS